MCPPSTDMTALISLGMLSIKWLIVSRDSNPLLPQKSTVASGSWGRHGLLETSRPSTSQACSMGLRSGLREGQGIDLTPREDLKSVTILARCGAALSSCNCQLRSGCPRCCVAHGIRWSFKTFVSCVSSKTSKNHELGFGVSANRK